MRLPAIQRLLFNAWGSFRCPHRDLIALCHLAVSAVLCARRLNSRYASEYIAESDLDPEHAVFFSLSIPHHAHARLSSLARFKLFRP